MGTTKTLGDWLLSIEPGDGLTASQRRVAEVIVTNQQLASYAEIAEIADRALVNASTVVRFAKALGFTGWPDLQRELRGRYLAGLTSEETLREHGDATRSAVHGAVTRDIDNLRTALDSLDPAESEAVVKALAGAGRILTVGSGSFASPAMELAHLGSIIGYPISYEGRGGTKLAAALTTLGDGDVLVAFNVWRPVRDVLLAATAARAAGCTVVALTDLRSGKLAALADHVLVVPCEGVSYFQSVTAATSVVSGLLTGMEAAHPERSRASLRRTQELWQQLGTFAD